MQAQLTKAQITRARKLRADGVGFAEIRAKLKVDVAPDTIRHHCLDVPVNGQARTRTAKGPMTRGGVEVRPFTDADDQAIIEWAAKPEAERVNANQLAKSIGRRRHVVMNRIKTLRKHGKIGEQAHA